MKEFQFHIKKHDWPEEMTLTIKEYDIIEHEGKLRRKLLCRSEYNFFHDADEDFSCKVWLKVVDAGGMEIVNTVYTRRDAENRIYWDIGCV